MVDCSTMQVAQKAISGNAGRFFACQGEAATSCAERERAERDRLRAEQQRRDPAQRAQQRLGGDGEDSDEAHEADQQPGLALARPQRTGHRPRLRHFLRR